MNQALITSTPPHNTQEAYERIRTYFSRPGAELAYSDEGECCYRTPDGNACALGCLLPDELYTAHMEGKNALIIIGRNPAVRTFLANVDPRFLDKAQKHHDNAYDTADFISTLDLTAEQYGLKKPA